MTTIIIKAINNNNMHNKDIHINHTPKYLTDLYRPHKKLDQVAFYARGLMMFCVKLTVSK